MRPVTRLGVDKSTGHPPGFPPVPAIMASTNVFVNKRGVVRQGDPYQVHCYKKKCHQGTATGSAKTFANRKGVTRLGDPITCGDRSGAGSTNVRSG